jgi:dinuclear metal center YbgI/SA1388 family protein
LYLFLFVFPDSLTMSIPLCRLLEHLHRLAPPELAEPWDNTGLLLGDGSREAENVLVCLDVTLAVLHEAIARNCQAAISHHPPIFKPLTRIDLSEPAGKILQTAILHDIALIACHTNLDSASGGVSDALAGAIGLAGCQPLQAIAGHTGAGLGRIGQYDNPVASEEFLRRVMGATANHVLSIAGEIPETIKTVALCGGSGSELAPLARKLGADVYLSGEIKHSTARWAWESGFCIIDGGHYGTERLAVNLLADWLSGLDIAAHRAKTEKSPFNLVHHPAHTTPITRRKM